MTAAQRKEYTRLWEKWIIGKATARERQRLVVLQAMVWEVR